MTDSTGGHRCPECGAPRGQDNTPSCDCTRRASDALRDARTAEQAAAEDFDPLRIRPYVDLAGAGAGADGGKTEPLPVAQPATMPLRAVPEPAGADAEPGDAYGTSPDPGESRRRRPRWALVLSVAGAVIGILAVAGFASGLFSHVTPTRDGAAPEDVRESVPDVTPGAGSPSAAPVTSRAPTSAVPSASAGASVSPTAPPSRTAS
ncbi:peptidoglycan-binding protein, partial [Streptomyces sp. NPDC005917]